MKKAWKKSQLVVLTRGKPEETVLSVCKGGDVVNEPGNDSGVCYQNCTECMESLVS
jgi:hypothetical protein